MDPKLDQKLLASFADMAEAQLAQSVLEAEGIPCRLGDLDQVPAHLVGALGTVGRSAGIWVLGADLERASALLADVRTPAGVDEAALEAEALGAEPSDHAGDAAAGAAAGEPEEGAGRFPRAARALALVLLLVTASLLVWRCVG